MRLGRRLGHHQWPSRVVYALVGWLATTSGRVTVVAGDSTAEVVVDAVSRGEADGLERGVGWTTEIAVDAVSGADGLETRVGRTTEDRASGLSCFGGPVSGISVDGRGLHEVLVGEEGGLLGWVLWGFGCRL